MKKIKYFFEYLSIRFLAAIVYIFPWKVNFWIGENLGKFFYYFLPYWRKITLKNLFFVYPHLTEIKIKKMAKKIYQNLCMVILEFFQMGKINAGNVDQFVEIEGLKNLEITLKKGKGAILITGHLGNWEIIPFVLKFKKYIVNSIYRPFDNIFLEHWINKIRERNSGKMIPRGKGNKEALRVLKNKGILLLLIDQNSAKHGIFVNFFGKLAATVQGPAVFSLHTNTPVIPLYSIRKAPTKHQIKIFPEIQLVQTENEEENIRLNTNNFNKIIEGFIKENPLQWLWLHPRWNTRPQGEKAFY